MLFTRLFALFPAVQVLAAPVTSVAEVKELVSPKNVAVPAKPLSLEDIVANARAHVGAIKSQLAQVNAGESSPADAKDAATELKDTFDAFMDDLKTLKAAKAPEANEDPEENGFFDFFSSLPIVGDVYDLVKDVITVADQIQSTVASGDVAKGVKDILGTVVGAAPKAIKLVTSIAGLL
ncbi:hypothetical protein FRC07_013754 [Ceratobasidium sp. 392]|nr:hypothetical protein FRC07_013754 [Ceratobasidium sp. 392]